MLFVPGRALHVEKNGFGMFGLFAWKCIAVDDGRSFDHTYLNIAVCSVQWLLPHGGLVPT